MTVTSTIALESAVAAAQQYAQLITDHDPDDGDHVLPGELRRTLARLRLLHGVPFSYLVPDAALLPLESIRFFHLDRAWTDAVEQGVLGIGTVTTLDRTQLATVYPRIRAEVDEAERKIRQPSGEPPLTGAGGAITGFLLRSRLVSGWPNLHVRAYARDVLKDDALTTEAESHPDRMKVLRLSRLAPAVLLALFDGVPAVVHIEEPRQGIQFGARLSGAPGQQRAKVHLRNPDTGALLAPDDELTEANSIDVPFRPSAPGVLHMGELCRRLARAHHVQEIEPHVLAMQMLRFPYRQVFGDPDDREGMRFYERDRFRISLSLSVWQEQVRAHLSGVQP